MVALKILRLVNLLKWLSRAGQGGRRVQKLSWWEAEALRYSLHCLKFALGCPRCGRIVRGKRIREIAICMIW